MTLETVCIEDGANPRTTLIVLHGLGADGNDFVPVCEMLDLDDIGPVRFVLPHAPIRPVTINGGYRMRAWYDIRSGDARDEDEAGIRASRDAIDALIAAERERDVPSERIVLMGFSQGCAMALFTGLRHPERLGALVGWSGYLPLAASTAEERAPANSGLPILLAHGRHDSVVPIGLGRASRDALIALGYAPQWSEYPMDHEVAPDQIAELNQFLIRNLRA